MNLLLIDCSPRLNGNSDTLMLVLNDYIYEEKDCRLNSMFLREYNFNSCEACDICGKTKNGLFKDCIQQDDEFKQIADLLLWADGIVFITPVWFGHPPDLFFKLINRTRFLRHQDFALKDKVVGVVSIAGRRNGGQETTVLDVWLWAMRSGCIIANNLDGVSQYGALCWAGKKADIMKDTWGIEQAKDLVDRVIYLSKVIKVGKKKVEPMKVEFCYKSGTRSD